jgi:hypothetical protein
MEARLESALIQAFNPEWVDLDDAAPGAIADGPVDVDRLSKDQT